MNTFVLEKSTNESTGKPEQKFDAAFKILFNWRHNPFFGLFFRKSARNPYGGNIREPINQC
jgi:hypothetical protein